MAFDREDTLKNAEKLLRQGRLDAAIAEYVRVLDDQPRDWNTANTLGDLYGRAGQPNKAVTEYTRIADHLFNDGFYPRAAAIYKKILKIKPDDEATQLQLGELSARQGLLVDAKSYFTIVADGRRARGDSAGADEMVVRLGSLDPSDIEARLTAARVLEKSGETIGAAMRFRELHADLLDRNKAEALAALREAVRLNPDDREGRAELAREAVRSGDVDAVRTYLDGDTAAGNPMLLFALLTMDLEQGQLGRSRDVIRQLIAADPAYRDRVVELTWPMVDRNPSAAFAYVDATVDAMVAASSFGDGANLLKEFVARVPGQIPALLKLVEVCVDGGLEAEMYETQAQLADAYLATGQAAEARVIAEDLVAREPWEPAHIDRFRRALVLLKVSDPDTLIAQRLSGEVPFTAKDHFVKLSAPPPEPEPAPAPEPPKTAAATPARSGTSAGAVEIDLTTMLGDLEGKAEMTPPDPEELAKAFNDFKSEVSRQDGSDDAAQHLKLARTYMEMGMSAEAIGALETAARSPRYRFEAGAMLARLYRHQQDLRHAIEWFERAAEAPAPGAEAGRALLYELGTALELSGDTARALAVFVELQADAGDYRDVAARVDRLGRVQTGG